MSPLTVSTGSRYAVNILGGRPSSLIFSNDCGCTNNKRARQLRSPELFICMNWRNGPCRMHEGSCRMKHAVDPPNVTMDPNPAAWWDIYVTIRLRLLMFFTKTTAFKMLTATIIISNWTGLHFAMEPRSLSARDGKSERNKSYRWVSILVAVVAAATTGN
jgi:hypothetical protein